MKKFSNLSSDIEEVKVDIEKIKDGEYEIESIIDVFVEPSNDIKEGVVGINTDLSVKEVKRGETIYITALLRKPGTTSFNSPSVQGVIKLRVVDIYYGLQYLNKVINK